MTFNKISFISQRLIFSPSPAEYIFSFFRTISAAVAHLFPFVPHFLRSHVYAHFIRHSITFEKRETKDWKINVFENEERVFVGPVS